LREAISRVGNKNAQREFYLTDLAEIAAGRGRVDSIEAFAEEVSGINDRVQLAALEKILQRRLATALLKSGVAIRDPDRVLLEARVTVDADTELGPGVELRGSTRIGAGCRIEAGCILTDATIADGVHLKPYCVVTDSKVGMGGIIGPFAHLRPESDL